MNRSALVMVCIIGGMGVLSAFAPSAVMALTTTTTTIIGQNVPSASKIGNGVVAFILPIVVMGFVVGLANVLGNKGESNSILIKLGLMVGALLGMMSLTPTLANSIPFALPLVAGVYLITYLWKRV